MAQGWEESIMEKTLYERLGGVFAIAAVVDHFSDAVGDESDRRSDLAQPALPNGTPTASAGCRG